jgi:hypothetical protein
MWKDAIGRQRMNRVAFSKIATSWLGTYRHAARHRTHAERLAARRTRARHQRQSSSEGARGLHVHVAPDIQRQ